MVFFCFCLSLHVFLCFCSSLQFLFKFSCFFLFLLKSSYFLCFCSILYVSLCYRFARGLMLDWTKVTLPSFLSFVRLFVHLFICSFVRLFFPSFLPLLPSSSFSFTHFRGKEPDIEFQIMKMNFFCFIKSIFLVG
jgi:hypothetical protein